MRHNRALVVIAAAALFATGMRVEATTPAVGSDIGLFQGTGDVGAVKTVGTSSFDTAKGRYRLTGSGTNMWTDHDEFHLVWRRITGNFVLTARASFDAPTPGANEHRKLGVIARTDLDPASAYADVALHGSGLTSLQYRKTKGATTEEAQSTVMAPDVLQIERHGDTFTMSVAKFGEPFETKSVDGIALGDSIYIGLFVCAHDPNRVEDATFDNVRIVRPAKDDFVPYRDYIGSHIEILDVDTGTREIVYSVGDSIQAPNWTRDGKSLIYNRNGKLYRFDLATRTPTEIDTGFATSNNNDHVLSFDGKMIGISNHIKDEDNNSNVFILPAKGGTPKRLTATGPSYLHGWSPDRKYVIYTAQRDGEFDIYRIPVAGGPEMKLTTAKGLDDGSEYAPDGKHIYFNSTRSGLMQLWRMGPDGSNPERVTNDAYNDWFPHVSPDGKRIVFLSFGQDVSPDDHPFYKRVYLRVMPVTGGPARVIAYVYGGQGTINVPSWSPDGKKVAFVSNSAEL